MIIAALHDTVVAMVTNRGGLPAVAWLGLTLTAGCSEDTDTDADPIVGRWNLTEHAMPYEDCTYTMKVSMDIEPDLSGEETRLFRYECQGHKPYQDTYDYPLEVEVLEPSQLYRITFPETGGESGGDSGGFDPGGGGSTSSGGTSDPPPEEDDRQMDCSLDGTKLECEETIEFSDGEDWGDGPGDGAPEPPPDPTIEIHVWKFEKG
jgi:hypothetical protein